MELTTDIDHVFTRPAAVALGTFDGVHLGHRAVIEKAVAIAREEGLSPAVFTFSELPKNAFLPPEKRAWPLCSFPEKAELIASLGVELLLAPPFTKQIASMPPEEFIVKVLIGRLKAKHVVCGYDHRFGAGGCGDAELLMRVCSLHGAAVTVIPPVTVNGEKVSSSRIRALVERGCIETARELLGHEL